MLVAEAGVLALIDTAAAPMSPLSYENPRLDPIGSYAVRAVDLLLDPGARLYTAISNRDVVYVAGGRYGLWGMQAHPTGGTGFAVRLDDALDANDLAGQSSERWCNDLATITVDSTQYLLVLFAEKNGNRVRAYDFQTLRQHVSAGVQAGQELGHELLADVEVVLDGNDDLLPDPWRPSFGLGMAVDGEHVYVAIGQQGVVRIDFSQAPSSTSIADGPYFGQHSAYAGQCNGLYGDFEYSADGSTTTYSHAPYFMDVAVERSGANSYLWAAVDHLGILCFDVTSPSAWGPSLPIDHQEGKVRTLANNQPAIRLFQDPAISPGAMRTFAHELRIANTPEGPALAVAVSKESFLKSDGLRSPGRTVNHLASEMPGNAPNTPGSGGGETKEEYTVLYHLADIPHPGGACGLDPEPNEHYIEFIREGARALHLQKNQPPDELVVYGGRSTLPSKLYPVVTSPKHTTFRAVLPDWPDVTDPAQVDRRLAKDRPGRYAYHIGHSPTNPELLYTGNNDEGLPADGFLFHCPSGISRVYDPGTGGVDARAAFGIVWNTYAVWPKEVSSSPPVIEDYVFGAGKPPSDPNPPRWMLVSIDPGANFCSGTLEEPDRNKRVFFENPLDRFGYEGRGYYSGGSVDLDYDLANEPAPGLPIVFGSRIDAPDGVVVMNRVLLEDVLEDAGVPDEFISDPEQIGAVLGTLDTHPEFANIQDPNGLYTEDDNFIIQHGLRGRVQTFFPRLLELKDMEAPTGPDHWMLAVPCSAVQLPDDLAVFGMGMHPEWKPDAVYIENYDHAMIRMVDVQDRDPIEDPNDHPESFTLLGPNPATAATYVEPLALTMNGDVRNFLFVTDLGGGILVWDVTELRSEEDGEVVHTAHPRYSDYYFEEWRTPGGAWDEQTNSLWSTAVDHVQWNDGEEERDEVYVYALVGRVGIDVLRFVPLNPPGQRLEWLRRIETGYAAGGLRIREDLTGERTLLLSEAQAGVRIFGYGGQ